MIGTSVIGQTLSHYRILALLGRGAMGEVFEAEDIRLGRRVALKLLPQELCSDPAAVERFQREARIISGLSHPNICTLYDIGAHGATQFMVMELLDGEPLSARLARGPLPLDDVLAFAVDVASALDAAHRQGVVHRDIKPANLYVTRDGALKVLDFGVAKLATGAELDATRAGGDELTGLGTAIGTVAYMSPEQARGQSIDGRSDLFSLGVVLYEMATGRLPFAGATPAVIFEGILTKAPVPPSSLREDLPADFDRIVLRALDKGPELRYQTAADFRADLKRLRRDSETIEFSAAPGPRRPRRRWWWLAAPLATAAVVAGVLLWQSKGTPALATKDLVVLADLMNRTGDAMFDDTLGEALKVQLRQSPFLNLVPEQRVQATLRMMQRPPMTPIDEEVGREVCQRVGGRALLTSAIAGLGSSYLVTLRALDCVTGDTLAERQVQTDRKEDVLRRLGDLATAFRQQLGESLASIKRYDANVEAATTSSLEALKAYSQGLIARRTQGDRAALPLLRRAVELDPDFALAHARLGTTYSNLQEIANARRHTTRAFELREKVSQAERLYIEARYYDSVVMDPVKAIEAYRVSIATFPADYAARVNLALLLRDRGELDEATAILAEAVRLSPEEPNAHANLASVYVDAGRFGEARKEIDQVLQIRDDGSARMLLMTIAVLSGDAALEAKQLEWARGPGDPKDALPVLWGAAFYRGHVRDAEKTLTEMERVYGAADLPGLAARYQARTASALATLGLTDRARVVLGRMKGPGAGAEDAPDRLVAAALVRDAGAARRHLAVALAALPQDVDSRRHEPALRSLLQLASGDSAGALATLGAVQYQLRDSDVIQLHGLLLLNVGRPADAIADFEWLREHARRDLHAEPAVVLASLARAYALVGRTADARKTYEDFFALWKDADPDVPLLLEARKAYAALPG